MNETILECSACDSALSKIIVLKEAPIDWAFYAECPFCGDKSYVRRGTGVVALEELGKVKILDTVDEDIKVCIKTGVK